MNLFQPISLGQLTLQNRILMAPMTRNRAYDGVPTDLHVEYYAQRASAGLIVTEATYIEPMGRGYPGEPGIYSGAQVDGWRKVTNAVHAEGGKIFLQLHHTGRMAHTSFLPGGAAPVAPSSVAAAGDTHLADGSKAPYSLPRALAASEIPLIIEEFGRAAMRSLEAGFDGVELHGANGYLPHEFLGSNTNLRTDDWGISVENRARFLLETLKRIASAVGPQRTSVKLSPGGFPPHDITEDYPQEIYAYVARQLSPLGLAYVHVQQPITDWGMPPLPYDCIAHFREHYGGRIFAGSTFGAESGNSAISKGNADAIFYGRHFLANPDLPERFRRGAALNAPDFSTFYTPGRKGYTDYPALSRP